MNFTKKENIRMRVLLSIIESTNLKILFINVLTALILFSCKEKDNSDEVINELASKNTYIELYYLAPGRNYPSRFNCGRVIGGPLPRGSERYYMKISDELFKS